MQSLRYLKRQFSVFFPTIFIACKQIANTNMSHCRIDVKLFVHVKLWSISVTFFVFDASFPKFLEDGNSSWQLISSINPLCLLLLIWKQKSKACTFGCRKHWIITLHDKQTSSTERGSSLTKQNLIYMVNEVNVLFQSDSTYMSYH